MRNLQFQRMVQDGSMDQGHKPDEFVSEDQLILCDQMLETLLPDCLRS